MATTENLLERREFKYMLPPRLVPRVRDITRRVCRLDEHAGPDGLYPIRSLYLDSRNYDLFRANSVEQLDRVKLRVRSYPAAHGACPVFLEVKRRVQDAVIKTRGGVPPAQWAPLVADPGALARSSVAAKARPAVERFVALVHGLQLNPVMLVEYDREAYMSEVDDYARVTFDLNVRCQPKDRLDLEADPKAWRLVDHPAFPAAPERATLLELKFAGQAPAWMANMVRFLELERQNFSKYCFSVTAQHLLPELRWPSRQSWRAWA